MPEGDDDRPSGGALRPDPPVIHGAHALAELGLPPLDAGDRLLGWRDEPGAYRYCHSFTDGEIDALAASVGHAVTEVARFRADGRDGALNSYLVLQVE